MIFYICIFNYVVYVFAGPATDSFKDQFCTDPRTMKKHAAYTEWADAYSCTRHRCQPGGRNLAIYTVGCKRVEAPESAIECEEVVEDTNMQFPYCCTRLRCLVVVRGEVWTRVLGQPWETLPAAPWSHMYKMKKPPPTDGTFLPKNVGEGPIYELTEPETEADRDKMLRTGKKTVTESPDCNEAAPRAAPAPDIVIALSTGNDVTPPKDYNMKTENRHKRLGKTTSTGSPYMDEENEHHDVEEDNAPTEKPLEASEEKIYANAYGVTQRVPVKSGMRLKSHPQVSWTEIPQNQWNEHEPSIDADNQEKVQDVNALHQPELPLNADKKPPNLQALVDAIGTRMRDIENVVQKMSEKVHQAKPGEPDPESAEKKPLSDAEGAAYHKEDAKDSPKEQLEKPKKPNPDEHYKRFSVRNRGSKYLHSVTEPSTSEQPLFIEDTNLNGYFSDASNNILRRASPPKEPAPTYMAPVDNTRRKNSAHAVVSENSDEVEKKHKKHAHKKKKAKGAHGHKKRHGKEGKKRFSRVNSVEVDRNIVSLEDSSIAAKK